jgi:hypothetical protein
LCQEIEGLNEGISTPDPTLLRNDEEDGALMGTLEGLEKLHLHSPQARYFGKSR